MRDMLERGDKDKKNRIRKQSSGRQVSIRLWFIISTFVYVRVRNEESGILMYNNYPKMEFVIIQLLFNIILHESVDKS